MTTEADRPEDREEDAPPAGAPEEPPGREEETPGREEETPGRDQETPRRDEEAPGDREPEAAEEPRREPRRRPAEPERGEQPEVVPGADLEPDLVLDEASRPERDEYGDAAYAERYAEPDSEAEGEEEPGGAAEEAPAREQASTARTPMELAADARYQATGKRKTSVARVILKPGSGTYTVNGRTLEQFFPRHGLQATARQPLSAAGYEARMDVVARLHGGGVSSQAGALRHGVARALVEADPSLREDLKRRGYLTRDPRAKERKKAGLKKARKRPQFSKR